MKPLLRHELQEFCERFENFQDAELRSLKLISPTDIELTLAVQDKARAYDWISLMLAFNTITDAKLIEDEKLHLVDMNDGAAIIDSDGMFAFGIGQCYNSSTVKSSTLYIISENLKYQEGSF